MKIGTVCNSAADSSLLLTITFLFHICLQNYSKFLHHLTVFNFPFSGRPPPVLPDPWPVPRRRHVLLLHQPGHVRVAQHQPQVRDREPPSPLVQALPKQVHVTDFRTLKTNGAENGLFFSFVLNGKEKGGLSDDSFFTLSLPIHS